MRPMECLKLAEALVVRSGSVPMFHKSYTDARQFYDVILSIEMALKQQALFEQFLAENPTVDRVFSQHCAAAEAADSF